MMMALGMFVFGLPTLAYQELQGMIGRGDLSDHSIKVATFALCGFANLGSIGDRVKVQVIKVDMERRQVDLGLVEILDAVRESEANRGPRRSKAQPRQERGKPGAARTRKRIVLCIACHEAAHSYRPYTRPPRKFAEVESRMR